MILEAERKISFGTDGFRGIISLDFTYENIRKIAQGFCDFIAHKGYKDPQTEVFIGYDRRFLSEKFAYEFAVVLTNNDIGCIVSKTSVPTPLVSYLTTKNFTFGIMITASHNHFIYNGVKIKYKGRSISPSMSCNVEFYVEKNINSKISRVPKKEIIVEDFRKEYVEYIRNRFDIDGIFSFFKDKIVFDFMYGSASDVFDMIFPKKSNVISIRTKRDPLFGDISSPEPKEDKILMLREEVKRNKAICGFSLDGDGDRVGCVDEDGNYIPPTLVAPIILDYLTEELQMKGKVVQTVSLGYLTQRIARAKKLVFEFTPVGFKYIADRLLEGDTIFGAEESGGYSWKGSIPDRDGFVSALMILDICRKRKKTLKELVFDIKRKYGDSYYVRHDVKLNKIIPSKYSYAMKIKQKIPKMILSHKIEEIITLDGIKVILDNDWWFLIRPSGTEPILRIYAEAENQKNLQTLINIAKDIALSSI